MVNCLISGNGATWGTGAYINSRAEIVNCTFTGNDAGAYGDVIFLAGLDAKKLKNCIFWMNESGTSVIFYVDRAPIVTYTDIEGGWEGEGNIDLDPRFVPFPIRGFEYILRPGSPCIDAGDPDFEDAISDWHPRWPAWYPDGARSDMGAYGGPGNRRWVN